MAVYDADAQRIIVRVVYDGPGRAGKTTNLERLCGFFTTMRRGELYTPAKSTQGRTLHFDWLNLEGGLIGGHRVRCQLVTVPGQRVLRSRRAHLISTADVVVFVCEGTAAGVAAARPMLAEIRELQSEERPLPLVVQANKQDLPETLDEDTLREQLNLGPEVAIVASQADEGVGVKETAVLAVRAAAVLLQRHVATHGVRSLDGQADDEQSLLEAMRAIGIDFEVPNPATVASRRHASTPGDREAAAEPASEAPAEEAASEAPASEAPASEAPASEAPKERAASEALAEESASEAAAEPASEAPAEESASEATEDGADPGDEGEQSPAPPRSWTRPAPGAPPPGSSLAERFANFDPTSATPVPKFRRPTDPYRSSPRPKTRLPTMPRSSRAIPEPPLPQGDVPSSQLWPSALGRRVLRQLNHSEAELRDDLRGQRGKADGSGSSTVIYRVGDWALKTRVQRRYADLEAGRIALVRLARAKVALRELLPPSTVLSLQVDPTDVFWLWTVAPWTPSLRAEMRTAEEASDEDGLAVALETYARACLQSLRLAAEDGVVLDVHPSNFSAVDGVVYYIDDDIGEGRRIASSGFALLRRVEEYTAVPAAVERYAEALESGIREELDGAAVRTLDLEALLLDVPLADDRAESVRRRLVGAVRGLG